VERFSGARSITIHVYDETKAKEVFAIIPRFSAEVEFLLSRLEALNTAS